MADAQALAEALAVAHPDEVAALLETSGAATSGEFLRALPVSTATSVLREMSSAHATAIVAGLPAETVSPLLDGLTPRAAAAVLRGLPASRRDAVLAGMGRSRQMQVALVLRQPQLSVGAWMDSSVMPVRAAATVADAKRMVLERPQTSAHQFVVDDAQKYLGRVAVAAIHAAADDVSIERLYEPGSPALRAGAEIEAALSDLAWTDNDELPVVNRHGEFVGAVRYAALREGLARREDPAIETARPPGVSFMDLADLWYVGLARILETSLSRRHFPEPGSKGETS